MNPEQSKETKNTVDNSQPSRVAAKSLSEDEKKQLELQAALEHEQGPAREELTDQAQDLEKKK